MRLRVPPAERAREALRLARRLLETATGAAPAWAPLAPGETPESGDVVLRPRGAVPRDGADGRRMVALLRLDPRWHLVDLLGRGPGDLPPGSSVAVTSAAAAALLRHAAPGLEAVEERGCALPEEMPRLVAGPGPGHLPGAPLDPSRWVPAPWTGAWVGLFPGDPPDGVADGSLEHCLRIEDALRRGVEDVGGSRGAPVGPPGRGPGAAAPGGDRGWLFALATPRAPILFRLRALRLDGHGEARTLDTDIPVEGAAQFARGFGRHLAGSS